MKARTVNALIVLLILSSLFALIPQRSAAAQPRLTGGVNILSVLPKKICVGDTITIHGAASVTDIDKAVAPIAWLPLTNVKARTQLGKISPEEMVQYNDGFYFDLTYKATQPGMETITLVVNNGVASTQERFQVEEKCDYDAFVTTVMHFQADAGDDVFQSITNVTGTGTMKRDRQGSQFYQGEGTWHLNEIMLSKPPMCVQFYMPPLVMSGPFELDGRLADEGEMVDVILSFLPNQSQSFYHGQTICVDENGEVGYGESWAQGGNPSLASKIEDSFPFGGGTKTVDLTGLGMQIVQAVGELDYTATLTLIPR